MPLLNLADLERDPLSRSRPCHHPCLSPSFDVEWSNTAISTRDRTAFGLGTRAHIGRLRRRDTSPRRPHTSTGGHRRGHGPGDGTAVLYGHLDKQAALGNCPKASGPTNRFAVTTVSSRVASATTATRPTRRYSHRGNGSERHSAQSLLVLIEASEESGSPDLRPISITSRTTSARSN